MKFIFCLTIFTIISFLINVIFTAPIEIDMKLKSRPFAKSTSSDKFKIKTAIPTDLSVLNRDILTLETCLGTPSQCFNLIYDTGSYHLWVPSINKTGCFECSIFNTTFSQTYHEYLKENQNLLKLNYVTGGAYGFLGTDIVKIGNGDSFRNSTLEFMVADLISFDVKGADGIIGFARNYDSKTNNALPKNKNNSIIEVLYESGIISKKVFSQKFTNPEKTQAKLFVGDLHEDFLDESKVTSCNVFPTDPLFAKNSVADLWVCRISHIIIGDNDAQNFDKNAYPIYSRAAIDSGTNYIMAPYDDIFPFIKYFENLDCKVERDPFRKINVFHCDLNLDLSLLPKLSIVMNGFAYQLPLEHIFKDYTEIGLKRNVMTIFFLENLDFWLIGQAFMKNYHILFDHEKNAVSFSALDRKYVSDVSSKTSDKDIVFRDYYFLFIVILTSIVVLLSVALFLCYKMKAKRRIEITTGENAGTYALFRNNNINSTDF